MCDLGSLGESDDAADRYVQRPKDGAKKKKEKEKKKFKE